MVLRRLNTALETAWKRSNAARATGCGCLKPLSPPRSITTALIVAPCAAIGRAMLSCSIARQDRSRAEPLCSMWQALLAGLGRMKPAPAPLIGGRYAWPQRLHPQRMVKPLRRPVGPAAGPPAAASRRPITRRRHACLSLSGTSSFCTESRLSRHRLLAPWRSARQRSARHSTTRSKSFGDHTSHPLPPALPYLCYDFAQNQVPAPFLASCASCSTRSDFRSTGAAGLPPWFDSCHQWISWPLRSSSTGPCSRGTISVSTSPFPQIRSGEFAACQASVRQCVPRHSSSPANTHRPLHAAIRRLSWRGGHQHTGMQTCCALPLADLCLPDEYKTGA